MSEDAYSKALEAFKAGDLETTFNVINSILGDSGATDVRVLPLLGDAMVAAGMTTEAAEVFERAATTESPDTAALLQKSMMLYDRAGNEEKAFWIALQLNKLTPDDVDVAYILVRGFLERGEIELVEAFKKKLINSDNPDHLALASKVVGGQGFSEEHLTLYKKLYALAPDQGQILFSLMEFASIYCDFDTISALEARLAEEKAAGNDDIFRLDFPRHSLMWTMDERINALAENVNDLPQLPEGLEYVRRAQPHEWGDKIRVGYLSNEFWDDHSTMRLLQTVLTAHDKDRFETTLFCYTPRDFIAMDSGNRQKWGRIISIEDMGDEDAAELIKSENIDILVDLKGITGGARLGLMNWLAAPVQVSWLGYPASTINQDVDYIIGDQIVLPDSSKPFYHEKFCRLPETYQPNDPEYRTLPAAASRAELNLPEDKIVIAAFSVPQKITPETMNLWLAILKKVPNSVLWMMSFSELAEQNIIRHALMQGIMPDRLIFAEKVSNHDHIARLQAADFAVDTFPYNGHTTTSDNLWAGLPQVTRKGGHFASRVSESLLSVIGLDELVASDNDDFVRIATELANDKARVASLKAKLNENRFRAPLFDAERFCRHLESAFESMVAKAKAGEDPDHFDVPALPPREAPFM
ncbi:hypothetical protein [Rhizobium sp. L1K21]|uniref:O-linked N-acetylglucosamine transferase, SPINDLY family protein n=1 Tax=Rhizobium sp. L1K21 TaxID=2954933 RepID=UPI002092A5B4|nr:hypothetical protein [Rhizobium sp. L1K21]MCO6186180.1 hypothetical protein [Rhizobium sp. L1K21]